MGIKMKRMRWFPKTKKVAGRKIQRETMKMRRPDMMRLLLERTEELG